MDTSDAFRCSEVYAAAELEAEGCQHIQPRLYPPRHPSFHHRHGKAHALRRTAGTLNKKFSQLSHSTLLFNDTFHIISAPELSDITVLIEPDAHGDTLLNLHEIACRIVDGNQRERTAGGIRNAFYSTRILYVRHGVDSDFGLVAHLDARQLAFPVVSLNPTFAVINYAHQRLTGINQLTHMNIFRADSTVAGGNDITV